MSECFDVALTRVSGARSKVDPIGPFYCLLRFQGSTFYRLN